MPSDKGFASPRFPVSSILLGLRTIRMAASLSFSFLSHRLNSLVCLIFILSKNVYCSLHLFAEGHPEHKSGYQKKEKNEGAARLMINYPKTLMPYGRRLVNIVPGSYAISQ